MKQRVGLTAALRNVWYWALLAGVYSVVPFVTKSRLLETLDLATLVDAAITFALGMLLLFRMNRAYERWWEARTLWGTLVNVSRNLAVKMGEFANPDRADRQQARKLVVGFAYGLKQHLRAVERGRLRDVPGFAEDEADPNHVPSYLSGQIYGLLQRWRRDGRITESDMWLLDQEARVLLDVVGGCEKIKNTLMSQSFPKLVRQALVLYVLYLPWSFAADFGLLTIPATTILAYFVIATEGIAHYVERPFGAAEDHLDLTSICTEIDVSVTEILNAA